MESAPTYFVVWCEGGGSPTVRHADFSTAKMEAKRLANQHSGRRFTVLAAIQGFEVTNLREVEYLGTATSLDQDLPF